MTARLYSTRAHVPGYRRGGGTECQVCGMRKGWAGWADPCSGPMQLHPERHSPKAEREPRSVLLRPDRRSAVDTATAVLAWNAADPATRGPHPTTPATHNSAKSPWRKGMRSAPSDYATVLRAGRSSR